MKEFAKFHPIVNFLYFLSVIGFSMIFMHPLTLCISLVCGFTYSILLNGGKALKFNLFCILPLVIATTLMNPIFNHKGLTVLFYLPSGNPLTLESVFAGIASGLMIWGVICHFSCFNKIMTSDKLLYLFGNFFPALSLIFSMVLRFIPLFKVRLKTVMTAQSHVGQDVTKGNITERVKRGIKIFSVMITWSMENAIDTADSMKSRGYGLPKRTAYSNFKLDKRDIKALFYIGTLSSYIIIGGSLKKLNFTYFPSLRGADMGKYEISIFIAYLLLFICPVIIELKEVARWKKLKSKI